MEEFKETLLYIIIGIILAFAINQGLAFALSTDMPVVAVESNSMVPTFYKGDILIIQGQKSYNVGDIIVFSPSPTYTPIVHRIIKINEDGTYQTLGDANNGVQLPFEKSIRYEQIHGKMILRIPYLGWIKIGIMEYIVPNILIIIFILVPIIAIYIKFWR